MMGARYIRPRLRTDFFTSILLIAVTSQIVFAIDLEQNVLLPLPPDPKLDERKVALGEKLFHDPILSGDQSLSCSTCHILSVGGDDNRSLSYTSTNKPRSMNTPTIYNAVYNFRFGQTGASESLKKMFAADVIAERAMNNTWPKVLSSLKSVDDYVKSFGEVYGDGITPDNILDVLITYQYSLVTPGSRFDQYLQGDEDILSSDEKRGFNLFKSYGCIACHQGRNVGGNLFQKFGLFGDYFADRDAPLKKADLGRYNVTSNERDRFYFRVPSLRNVAVTAPYLHDGSIETLDEMIDIMGRYQLGRKLNKKDREDIAAFLKTLTGLHNRFDKDES